MILLYPYARRFSLRQKVTQKMTGIVRVCSTNRGNYNRFVIIAFALVIVKHSYKLHFDTPRSRRSKQTRLNPSWQDRSFVRIGNDPRAYGTSLSIHGDPSRVDKILNDLSTINRIDFFPSSFISGLLLLLFFLTYLKRFLRHDTC